MTDEELIARLRKKTERCHDLSGIVGIVGGVYWIEDMDCREAADRIKALEAKLENLLGGAETVLEAWDSGDEASFREAIEEMRADVAEARGEKA